MFTYHVIEIATGELKFVYDAESPIEWNEYPFSLFNHEEHPYAPPVVTPPEEGPKHIRLTKLEFLRRFSINERIALRQAAQASPQVYDYMALLELAEEVFLDDPDTVGGVEFLEQIGLIGVGRAAEILNG